MMMLMTRARPDRRDERVSSDLVRYLRSEWGARPAFLSILLGKANHSPRIGILKRIAAALREGAFKRSGQGHGPTTQGASDVQLSRTACCHSPEVVIHEDGPVRRWVRP